MSPWRLSLDSEGEVGDEGWACCRRHSTQHRLSLFLFWFLSTFCHSSLPTIFGNSEPWHSLVVLYKYFLWACRPREYDRCAFYNSSSSEDVSLARTCFVQLRWGSVCLDYLWQGDACLQVWGEQGKPIGQESPKTSSMPLRSTCNWTHAALSRLQSLPKFNKQLICLGTWRRKCKLK